MVNFQSGGGFAGSQYTPIEIRNFKQRKKDRDNNEFFKLRKVRCRPWKCGKYVRQDQGSGTGAGRAAISNSTAGNCAECEKCKSKTE